MIDSVSSASGCAATTCPTILFAASSLKPSAASANIASCSIGETELLPSPDLPLEANASIALTLSFSSMQIFSAVFLPTPFMDDMRLALPLAIASEARLSTNRKEWLSRFWAQRLRRT